MDERFQKPTHEWHDRSLPGMGLFPGPSSVREEFIDQLGIDWTASYIDQCGWDEKNKTLLCRHGFARDKIRERGGHVVRRLGLKLGVQQGSPMSKRPTR